MSNRKGESFDAVSIGEIAEVYHVTRRSVDKWKVEGCPINPDKTMSIYQVHNWLMERASKKNSESEGKKLTLKDQKLEKDIEFTDVKIQKAKGELVSREIYEDAMASAAKTESEFWRTAVIKNSIYMANQPKEILEPLLMRFLCEGTQALVGRD